MKTQFVILAMLTLITRAALSTCGRAKSNILSVQ